MTRQECLHELNKIASNPDEFYLETSDINAVENAVISLKNIVKSILADYQI